MEMKATVLLRDSRTHKEVKITDTDKPVISQQIIDKWQKVVNLMAKIVDIPAGLIMKINEDNLEVLVRSEGKENPYKAGDSENLGHGLYCETVIGKNVGFFVENARQNKTWQDNPDIKLNMVSYYGLPLKWPDEEFFGTICVLDNKAMKYSEMYRDLLIEFKQVIEKDLEVLCYQNLLVFYSEKDTLTTVYNRRKIEDYLENEFKLSRRNHCPFSIMMIDINKFKQINDQYGHQIGDKILTRFATAFNQRIRSTDKFGRWGGDEFLLICPNTPIEGMYKLIDKIYQSVVDEMSQVVHNHGFCFGLSESDERDESFQSILKRADLELYKNKKNTA